MKLKYEGIKYKHNHSEEKVLDAIVHEKALQITINNKPFTVTLRMPGNDLELAIGLLYAENIINTIENIEYCPIILNDIMDQITIKIPKNKLKKGYLNSRNFLSVSSCGICGKTELPEIKSTNTFSQNNTKGITALELEKMFAQMQQKQQIFKTTGGCHAAAIFDQNKKLIVCKEDIGRHNAVDKVVGNLLLTKKISDAHYMLVSGRVSYEIIIKTFRAKIPVLAAVSAPSSLAIDYAKELGIQLYGFCRADQYTRYS